MKKAAFLAITIFIVSVFVSPAHAQLGRQTFHKSDFTQSASIQTEIDLAETEFSKPGLLPDHPLYFLKRLGENIRLIFTPDVEKPRVHLEFAKTRLAEAKKLVDENRARDIRHIIHEFSQEINESEKGQHASLLVKEREDTLIKSTLILGLVLEKVPEQAKPAIEHALDNSIEKKVRIKIESENKEISQEDLRQVVEKERQRHVIERETGKKENAGLICIQVITSARNPLTGETRNFPTPCDVPPDWIKVQEITETAKEVKGEAGLKTHTNTKISSEINIPPNNQLPSVSTTAP